MDDVGGVIGIGRVAAISFSAYAYPAGAQCRRFSGRNDVLHPVTLVAATSMT